MLEKGLTQLKKEDEKHLGYFHGGRWEIRTPGPRFRRPVLYPSELIAQYHIKTFQFFSRSLGIYIFHYHTDIESVNQE